ncbi:MLO-like protein 1 isoform X2 [Primulina huaijiensis]|uniref:MLO-like protein 1 isoform X2 n=1 Tax=Primulina huaijiensis TaxID=1492673 RepID=UPI003CC77C37
MSGGEEGEGASLEFTPTWVIAAVCTVIVAISLAAERLLHYTGKYLKSKDQKPLYEALQKVKEELMLLGFISLMLTVFQGRIVKICVPSNTMKHMLPCSLSHESSSTGEVPDASPDLSSHHRRLFAAEAAGSGYCASKNKVPLLSLEALHHLHIFIFVLAIVHVTFSVLTVVFGGAKIRQWKHWEVSIAKDNHSVGEVLKPKFTNVHQHDFIKKRFLGLGRHSVLLSWLLLLAVGTKLEHIISQLAHEVAEKHVAIEGDLVVQPSDDHFWFRRPHVVLFLIHFILFQNAFEIAFFFWIWVQFGFDSCIMGQVRYIVPRLIIGVFIQILCSYSTLPLYALVTQMGTHFKKSIFDEHVQAGLVGWAQKAKKRKGLKAAIDGSTQAGSTDGSAVRSLQMVGIGRKETTPPTEIQPSIGA